MSPFSKILLAIALVTIGAVVLGERTLLRNSDALSFYGELAGSFISIISIILTASIAYDFKRREDRADSEQKRNAVLATVISFSGNGLVEAELYAREALILADHFSGTPDQNKLALRRHFRLVVEKRSTGFETLHPFIEDNLFLLDPRIAGRVLNAHSRALVAKRRLDIELQSFAEESDVTPDRDTLVSDAVSLYFSFAQLDNALAEHVGSKPIQPNTIQDVLIHLRRPLAPLDLSATKPMI